VLNRASADLLKGRRRRDPHSCRRLRLKVGSATWLTPFNGTGAGVFRLDYETKIGHDNLVIQQDVGGGPLQQKNVYVVDDDRDVRRSLSFMLGTAELTSRPFASGTDFLENLDDLKPGCILLDIRMPQVDGFHVMAELLRKHVEWPVIVMTGHGEVSVAVRAMKLGAVDFIEKPFEEAVLLSSLDRAFVLLKDRGETAQRKQQAQERVNALTAREMEVLQGLMAGMANKLLARELDISLRTVEMHRANMMDRLGVSSLAEALTLAVQAGVEPLNKVS
jgi:two-component system, LuxR family, response regulator FixJ